MVPNVRTARDDGTRIYRPAWVTIRDYATDVIQAGKLYDRMPTAGQIASLFRQAMEGRVLADGTRTGGVPRRVRCDQGGQFGALLA